VLLQQLSLLNGFITPLKQWTHSQCRVRLGQWRCCSSWRQCRDKSLHQTAQHCWSAASPDRRRSRDVETCARQFLTTPECTHTTPSINHVPVNSILYKAQVSTTMNQSLNCGAWLVLGWVTGDRLGAGIHYTAGGQKCVIITVAVQAVGCCMAYFHANNYNFSSKLLLEIS